MLTKSNFLLLSMCLSLFSLLAQPPTTVIDLRVEDTNRIPLELPAVSQVVASPAWLSNLLQGDTLYIRPNLSNNNRFQNKVLTNPGKINKYSELTIFSFLEDQRAFQDYLMNRAYQASQMPIRNKGILSEEGIGDKSSRNAADESANSAALSTYPLVRQYAIGYLGLLDNPNYLRKLNASNNVDASYLDAFNRYANLIALYQSALVDPKGKGGDNYPVGTPEYFFTASQEQLYQEVLPYAANRLGSVVKNHMTQAYISRHRTEWRVPAFRAKPWPANELAEITDEMAVTPLNAKDRAGISRIISRLERESTALKQQQQALFATYRNHGRQLNEQEIIFFKWILQVSGQMIVDLSIPLEYLSAINQLPIHQTNYAQLLTATDLLRKVQKRLTQLPDEARAKTVLNNITTMYFNKIAVSEQFFRQKQRNR